MLHRLHFSNIDIEGEELFSLSYRLNINQDNDLKYGTVASANLNFSSTRSLSRGTQFSYYVTQAGQSEKLVGVFFIAKVSKTSNTYHYTCYDKLSAQGIVREDYKTNNSFTYVSPANIITYGTYGLINEHTFSDDEYMTADIAQYTCTGEGITYTPVTIKAFSDCGLSVGDRFSIDGVTSYVMELSWDDTGVIISSFGTDPFDNAPGELEYLESTVLQQGQLITALTIEQGKIEAIVERKNGSYRQGTIPADDDGTNYDLLYTGDLWFCTEDIYDEVSLELLYQKDKWYICTASGTHEAGTRVVTWTETTDAEIADAISRVTIAEGRITTEVSARTQADTNLDGRIDTTNANVSRIDQTVEGITTTVSSHTTSIQTLDGEVEDLGESVDGLNTIVEDHESRIDQTADAISAEVTRATNAEDGKINNSGYLTKTGYRWNLTDTNFTIDSKNGNTWKTVMTVNDDGLSVEGDVQADTGHIGNFALENGWFHSTSSGVVNSAITLDHTYSGNTYNTGIAPGSISVSNSNGNCNISGNEISNSRIDTNTLIKILNSLQISGRLIAPSCVVSSVPSSGVEGQIVFVLQ